MQLQGNIRPLAALYCTAHCTDDNDDTDDGTLTCRLSLTNHTRAHNPDSTVLHTAA